MATKVSKAEQEQIKKAQAQAMEDSARQFLDEKTILNMQAAGRQRQQEQTRRDELLRQQAIAQQGLSAEDRLRQAFGQERTEYENRLNNERDQQYMAMQQEQANQQANYERQISDLQRKMNDRQAGYDATVKALQDQLKIQTAANQKAQSTAAANPVVANQTASNPATQNTAQRNAQGEVDFTKAPQAQTAEDVNNQDARTRLWQSLNATYSNQMDESDKAYDRSISQQNNVMLARGMGRSSYAGQISANMYNEKNQARNRLGQALIADYQNRIGEAEAKEQENEWRQKQFEEGVRQFNAGQELTRSENALNRAFNTSEREAQQQYQAGENALNRDFQTSEREAQQAYNTAEREAQQGWQAEQAALNREQEQARFEVQQAFAEKQWEAQQDQWKQEFDYNAKTTEQKLAYDTAMNIISQGNDPSDEVLSKAGLSRTDANAMKAQAKSAGVVPSKNNDENDENDKPEGDPIEEAGKGSTLDQDLIDKLLKLENDKKTVTNAYAQSLIDNDIRAVRKALGYKD